MNELATDATPPPPPPEVPSDIHASFDATAKEVCTPAESPAEATHQAEQSGGESGGWNGLPPQQIEASLHSRLFGETAPSGAAVDAPPLEVVTERADAAAATEVPNGGDTPRALTPTESEAWVSNFENEMRARVLGNEPMGTLDDAALPPAMNALTTAEADRSERREYNEGALEVRKKQEEGYTEQALASHEPPSDHQQQHYAVDPVTATAFAAVMGVALIKKHFRSDGETSQLESDLTAVGGTSTADTSGANGTTPSDSATGQSTAAVAPTSLSGTEVTEALAASGDSDAQAVKKLADPQGLERAVEDKLGVAGPEVRETAAVPNADQLVREVRLTSEAEMRADEAQNRTRLEDAATHAAAKAQTELAFDVAARQQREFIEATSGDDARFAERKATDERAFNEKTEADRKFFEDKKAQEDNAFEQRRADEEAFTEKQAAEKAREDAKIAQEKALAERTAAEQKHFDETKAAEEQAYERKQAEERQLREESAAKQKLFDEMKAAEEEMVARKLADEKPVRPQFTGHGPNNGPRF